MAASSRLQALVAPLHGELDDQNRVLAQQTDQHDQTDLGVDVVGQPHGLQEQERAEDADRQREDDGQRKHEALVLPDQHQVHEGDDDQEDVDGLVALVALRRTRGLPSRCRSRAAASRRRLP